MNSLPKWLFLHIPKTAGSSIITALNNVFGEKNVYRVTWSNFTQRIDLGDQLRSLTESHEVLIGHVHFPFWEPLLDGAHAFTVLRDPVDRVLSLYRFATTQPRDELARFGLGEKFSLTEFLSCDHPGIARQVNDGMCDFLGSTRTQIKAPPVGDRSVLLHKALDNLKRLDVAFTDNLPVYLGHWAAKWGVPFDIRLMRENVTHDPSSDAREQVPLAIRDEIIARNALDIALYQEARRQFLPPSAPTHHATTAAKWDPRTVLRVVQGATTPISEIPGRMGFHLADKDAAAWIADARRGEINCLSAEGALDIELHMLAPVPDYPVETVKISVNGWPALPEITRAKNKAFRIYIKGQRMIAGLNRISIELTHGWDSNRPGHRPLSVALEAVRFC